MIYLMRHGADDEMRLGGWSDAPLSLLGVAQAEKAAEMIAESNYVIQHIVASDLPRAEQTADIVGKRLEIAVDLNPLFREVDNGVLAGMPKEDARKKYPGLYWRSLGWEESYPNGESPKQFFERIKAAWEHLKANAAVSNGDTLLVTHAGVIDVILCLENGVPYTNRHTSFRLGSAKLTAVPIRCKKHTRLR